MTSFLTLQRWFLYLVAIVVVPGIAAVSIVSERDLRTSDLIATSLLPPACLVLGKHFAILTFFVLLSIVVLPFTGVACIYGQVGIAYVLVAAAQILAAAWCACGVGIWASASATNPTESIGRTFAGILFMLCIPRLRADLQPYVSIYLDPALFAATGWFLTGACAIAVAIRADALRECTNSIGNEAESKLVHLKTSSYSVDYLMYPDRVNPFWEKLRRRRHGHNAFIAVLGGRSVVLFYCIIAAMYFVDKNRSVPLPFCERLLLMYFPPLAAWGMISDRDHTNIDMYRLTPRRAWEYVLGRFRAALWQLYPILPLILSLKFVFSTCTVVTGRAGALYTLYWLDLFVFPAQLISMVAVAFAAASFTRSAVIAITLACCVALGFGGVLLMANGPILAEVFRAGTGHGLTFVAINTIMCVLGFAMAVGVAYARATYLWHRRG